MAKRKEKEREIEYELDLEDLEAAEKAAREQYASSLDIVNIVDELPSLEDFEDDPAVFELPGQIVDLKNDFAAWVKAAKAVVEARKSTALETGA
jgi:hypothetical protein